MVWRMDYSICELVCAITSFKVPPFNVVTRVDLFFLCLPSIVVVTSRTFLHEVTSY
jgi:hypothetical protein